MAGLVIMLTGWTRADAIASLLVCALMLHAARGLLRDAGRILLDEVQACLAGHFDVEHSTFQLEPAAHGAHELAAHH